MQVFPAIRELAASSHRPAAVVTVCTSVILTIILIVGFSVPDWVVLESQYQSTKYGPFRYSLCISGVCNSGATTNGNVSPMSARLFGGLSMTLGCVSAILAGVWLAMSSHKKSIALAATATMTIAGFSALLSLGLFVGKGTNNENTGFAVYITGIFAVLMMIFGVCASIYAWKRKN